MFIFPNFILNLIYCSLNLSKISLSINIMIIYFLGYYVQLEETKKIKGRQELVYHHEDHKIPFRPFVGIFIRREILDNNSDSFINWLRRYIKESGF